MKKLLLMCALVSLLVFGLATSALASSAYLDYFSGGADANYDGGTMYDGVDFTGFILGLNTQVGNYNIGLEYGSFEDDVIGLTEASAMRLSVGYLVINDDSTKIAMGLGYSTNDIKDLEFYDEFDGFGLAELNFSGFTLEFYAAHNVDKFLFEAGLSYAINGEVEVAAITESDIWAGQADADMLTYYLRFSYLFTDNFGVSLGYRSFSVADEFDTFETDLSGITLGATYKF